MSVGASARTSGAGATTLTESRPDTGARDAPDIGPGETTVSQKSGNSSEVVVAAGVVAIVAMMILPLPAVMMDLLLSASMGMSLLILVVAVQIPRPLDLSLFPSLLLLTTLLRLSLNVGTTRLILLHGAEGTHAAGRVVEAFGDFVVGGSYAVGGIVFIILVLVNFVVITKGAGRVAEVAARFTLDALPGKQMAIDADLGAGLIDENTARRRRREVAEEADFYGAMDGASKFVRGDAIAGLLITGVNIVGGIVLGTVSYEMPMSEAAGTFTTLTIGDGLLSQIPALAVSTAAGIVVTRASGTVSLGPAITSQLFGRRRPLAITAALLCALGLVPGMPHLPFLILGGVLGAAAWGASRFADTDSTGEHETPTAHRQDQSIENLIAVDLISVEVGSDLLSLADVKHGGDLLERITGIRRTLAGELGLLVPAIRVRDDLALPPKGYRIRLSGEEIGTGELHPDRRLAIDPGVATKPVPGLEAREPAFGLPARWALPGDAPDATEAGYTVVEPSAVLATHLGELLRRHAHELIGRREAQQLVDLCARDHARLVEDLIPNLLSLGEVIKVLKNLLREGVPIRDMRTILESLADEAAHLKDPDELTERARQRLSRTIAAGLRDEAGIIRVIVLDSAVEEVLHRALPTADPPPTALDLEAARRVATNLESALRSSCTQGRVAVLTLPKLRRTVRALVQKLAAEVAVVSHRELDGNVRVQAIATVTPGAMKMHETRAE